MNVAPSHRPFREAQDEDANGENPFGNAMPFLNHFWDHNAQFQRTFDDGLGTANSAPNRAVEYFRGGLGRVP